MSDRTTQISKVVRLSDHPAFKPVVTKTARDQNDDLFLANDENAKAALDEIRRLSLQPFYSHLHGFKKGSVPEIEFLRENGFHDADDGNIVFLGAYERFEIAEDHENISALMVLARSYEASESVLKQIKSGSRQDIRVAEQDLQKAYRMTAKLKWAAKYAAAALRGGSITQAIQSTMNNEWESFLGQGRWASRVQQLDYRY